MNMDDLDKLSCKEEIFEVSDVEPNASDDSKINEGKTKKRRRRRREVDLMSEGDETEETEDEGLNKKLYRRLSPAPGPHSPASHREPRTCVLKAKGIPLSKDETKALLRLIESSRILASRGINAATNRMKVVEWKRITEAFNATAAASRRSPRQLRLKWENLKKNSRKRSSLIRINSSQTESDARRYIGPDDILDRVAGLLDGAGSGLEVPMNAKRKYKPMQDIPMQDKPIWDKPMRDKPMRDKPMRDKPMRDRSVRDKPVQDDWVAARNRALAEYYITKKQYLLAKMNNLLLENTKLKLEVESLKRDRSES